MGWSREKHCNSNPDFHAAKTGGRNDDEVTRVLASPELMNAPDDSGVGSGGVGVTVRSST